VLRPLRLIFPAEKLRPGRILLLKASHLPHVFAIRLYEKLRRRIDDRRYDEFSLAAATTTGQRRNTSKRYSRSKRLSTPVPQLLAAADLLPSALLEESDQSRTATSTVPEESIAASIDDFKAAVSQLTSQVEALTRKVDSLQTEGQQ